MTKFDDIYELAADNYGLITSAQARAIGVTNNELVQYAKRGKVERVGQGLYRLVQYIPTPYDSYAEAVALVGPGAYLFGESVIAMHELAPTNPSYVHVATPNRVRRKLPPYIKIFHIAEDRKATLYEGIPSQTVANAIRSCRGKMMDERLRDATSTARAKGYLTRTEEQELLEELS